MATSHNATFGYRGYYQIAVYVHKGDPRNTYLRGVFNMYQLIAGQMTVRKAIEQSYASLQSRPELTLAYIGVRCLAHGEIKFYKPSGRRFYPQPKRK